MQASVNKMSNCYKILEISCHDVGNLTFHRLQRRYEIFQTKYFEYFAVRQGGGGVLYKKYFVFFKKCIKTHKNLELYGKDENFAGEYVLRRTARQHDGANMDPESGRLPGRLRASSPAHAG